MRQRQTLGNRNVVGCNITRIEDIAVQDHTSSGAVKAVLARLRANTIN